MVKITLVKSLIGAKPNQKKTAQSLGLGKIGDSGYAAGTKKMLSGTWNLFRVL